MSILEDDASVFEKLLDEICYRPSASTIPAHMASCEESFKAAPTVKKTANQLLNTVSRCSHRLSAKHLIALLHVFIGADEAFAGAFADRVVARAKGLVHLPPPARTTLVRMIAVVLAAPSFDTQTLGSLVQAQVGILEANRATLAAVPALRKAIVPLCLARPDVRAVYTQLATATTGDAKFLLARLLLEAFLPTFSPEDRSLWLSAAVYQALEAKTRPSHADLAAFAPLLATLSAAEFDDVVAPVLSRMLKRSPDSLLDAAVFVVRALPAAVDLSAHVAPLFGPLFPAKLKSVKDDVRDACQQLLAAVISRCTDATAVTAVVTDLVGLLEGKFGLLAQFFMRDAVFQGLAAVGAAVGTTLGSTAARALAADLVLPALPKAIAKEANDVARSTALWALGRWLALHTPTTAPLSGDIRALFEAGLASKNESVVVAHARALLMLARSHAEALLPLAPHLAAVAAEAQKKPNVAHLDGVLALAALTHVALAFPEAHDAAALRAPESFFKTSVALLAQQLTAPASAIESPEETALKGVGEVLARVGRELPPAEDANSCALLVMLLHHRVAAVRDHVRDQVRLLVQEQPWTATPLLAAFADALRSLAPWAAKGAADADDAVVYNAPSTAASLAGVLRRALRAIVPEKVLADDDSDAVVRLFPQLLVVAHHPLVVHGRRKDAFASEWTRLKARFVSDADLAPAANDNEDDAEDDDEDDDDDMAPTVHDHVDDLFYAVAGLSGSTVAHVQAQLFAPTQSERTAAQRALVTLLEFAGNGLGEALVLSDVVQANVAAALQAPAVTEVSDDDVEVWCTPDDTLHTKAKKKAEDAPRHRGRGTEDERWEAQVREELARKRAADASTAKKVKYSKEELELLAVQKQTRARLREAKHQVACVDELLAFVAATSPEAFQPALPHLAAPVAALLASPLFADFAFRALQHLGRCVMPAHLRAHAAELAAALQIAQSVAVEPESAALLIENRALFERLFALLSTTVFGSVLESEDEVDLADEYHLLSPSTLHMVFPVLRVFLLHSTACRQLVRPLFAVHAKMISQEEEMEVGDTAAQRLLRRSMLDATLAWLVHDVTEQIPATLAPAVVLRQICAGAPLSRDEWAPLVGDLGLLSPHVEARRAVLEAMLAMVEAQFEDEDEDEDDITQNAMATLLASTPALAAMAFYARFDADAENRSIAEAMWPLSAAEVTKETVTGDVLLPLLRHPQANVRDAAAAALAHGMKLFPDTVAPTLKAVQAHFLQAVPDEGAALDAFGAPVVRRANDLDADESLASVLPRLGAGVCIEHCAKADVLSRELVMSCTQFVLAFGLGDLHPSVRASMRKTGVQMMDSYGAVYTNGLLLLLEAPIAPPAATASPKELEAYDHRREGVVVCLGSLAKHMDRADPKVSSIVHQLLEALAIPSEAVQRAIANVLSPLMAAVKDESPIILDELLTKATAGETFGDRMGAAFGVSAVVKGLGIAALKQHQVIPRLEEAMKISNPNARQGALAVMECLCERLGFLFEPYVIVILPILLKSFADTSAAVREAASGTAKGIMRHLSAHGVKLILPAILRAVDDPAWRTKQAAIQLLGAMASCAPKQLGSCLPQIIPKLTAALSDSHPRVKDAGHAALVDIAHVVRNPEIASIANVLLAGLQDPNRKTTDAMQALQSTTFVHAIDAPSLALVMPVLQRGLTDRVSETKKKAALIVGNMCSMVNDAKDLAPYLDTISPCLQTQLLDPIPEVRTVASKALGMLVKGLGQSHFPLLVPSLLSAIKSEASSVERSGSAQGLCEVLVNLGADALDHGLRDEVFPLARHPKAAVREGVLWVLAFLPPALGKGFAKYLGPALPMIVAGLSDEAEGVRDVAMHAGSIVVNAHALSNTKELLPALEAGIFDDNWRIRQSSIALLGDLLYRVSGTKAVAMANAANDDDDDDGADAGSAAGEKAMLKALGKTRRDAVLAALYMVRSDTSAVVRQSALQVWKSVVSNTPKTLRAILETLMLLIVQALSGASAEKQTVAGRTLGEIVRKLGERVMPEVVPILRAGLAPTHPAGMRQGVCLGLAEVIQCSPKKQLEDFVDTLVAALEDALSDALPEVRRAAGGAFDVFHKNMGYRAIDELVPRLLKRIASVDDLVQDRALAGLQEVLKVKSREVLPYLVPRLLATPLSAANVQAIGRIAGVSGAVLHFHMDRILQVLFTEYLAADDAMAAEIQTALRAVALSVEPAGVQWLAAEMAKYCEADAADTRYLACWLIAAFCQSATVHYEEQVPIFLKYVLARFNDADARVVAAASAAFAALNVTIRPDELAKHIDFVRNNLNALVSDARHRKGGVGATGVFVLPALALPKGLDPFLPAYQHALMNGSPEARQSAAAGLGELVMLASPACLKGVLIKITGPLIRIAGDRFPGHVKAAILATLEVLLRQGGVALKPFLPQLQTTFVKALSDASAAVRGAGGSALGHLVALAPRLDPLVAELTDKLATTTGGVQEANLAALLSVLERAGAKLSPTAVAAVEDALRGLLATDDDGLRAQAAHGVALVLALGSAEHGIAAVAEIVAPAPSWPLRHAAALVAAGLLALVPAPAWMAEAPLVPTLVALATDEHATVRAAALAALGLALTAEPARLSAEVVAALAAGLADASSKDVNRAALRVVKRVAKAAPKRMRQHLSALVPPTFAHVKSTNIGVKFAAERALLYLLEVPTRPETLAEYAAGADQGKLIAEYGRRVLAKLKAGDDSEDDQP
ncbi:translational activator GCN1 [Achlya hypogyna]|uniref:Translational activator GCN1 n=1 Tax=Achlya hypogyna TaxID=1202772 RepID=A0A1V9YR34_ACHHY|nr:translational activator GCN1 [Achlya hypogyna]